MAFRLPARTNIELSGSPRFARRVTRLAIVCVVMVGLILWLSVRRGAPEIASALLLAGWLTMPSLLAASLLWPGLRVWLIGPSTAVTLGALLAVRTGNGFEQTGWWLIFAGIVMGDILGLWLWMRLAPVTGAWIEPFSRERWIAIAIHVALVLTGVAIVSIA